MSVRVNPCFMLYIYGYLLDFVWWGSIYRENGVRNTDSPMVYEGTVKQLFSMGGCIFLYIFIRENVPFLVPQMVCTMGGINFAPSNLLI